MTSITMYNAWLGYDGDPSTMNEWLTDNSGYVSGCLIVWDAPDSLGFATYYV